MRVTALTQKFNAGEMTPKLDGFVGFDKYASGCRIMENLIPLAQGPVTRRPGTKFAAESKDSTNRVGFIPFEFSTVQAYVIEVGDLYMRFYRNNGPVLETAQNITGATQANPVVITYSGADNYANGNQVEISGVVGMTQLNGRRFKVANVSTGSNTFELQDLSGNNVNGTAYTAYSSGGTVSEVYTLTTTYAQADLFDSDGRLRLKYAQSADVMYLVHPDYAPKKLTRTADASWTIADVDFTDGPYLDENTTATTLTASATTGSVTVTASAATFASTDVGRLIRIGYPATSWAASTAYSVGNVRYNQGNVYECVTAGTSGSSGPSGTGSGIIDGSVQWDWVNAGGLSWGWLTITAYTSTTEVTATVERTLGSTSARTTWRLGAWSETTGYPVAVGFHEERLFFGGALFNPQRLDASKINDFENFTPGARDADPLAFAMASDQVNAIKSFASARDLIVLTQGAEGRIGSDSLNAPLTPTNVTVRWQTRHGSADLLPETISNAVLFVQRAGKKVREFAFTIEADSYKAPDLTVLAEHISGDGLTDLAYQQEPWSVLWAPRLDGQLTGLTYWRDEGVTAWHRHVMGGVFGEGDPVVEAICTIPVDGADQLWLSVKRTINGRTVRTIEYMDQPLADTADQEDAFYVDCGLTYSGSATSTLSGLWHLEGQTVKVWTNKGVHPDEVVSSGQITLDYEVTAASVGLGYTWRLKPMRLEAGAQAGTAQAQIKRVDKVWVRFYRSLSAKVGRSETSGQFVEISFRDGQSDTGTAPQLFSGDKEIPFSGDYDRDAPVLLFGNDPTPVTILCLVIRMNTNEG